MNNSARMEFFFSRIPKALFFQQSKSYSGDWSFQCQHGSNECKGNKYQACALNQKKGQDNDLKFVNCAMGLPDPSDTDGIQNVSSNV